MLDLDHPHWYSESSTDGHGHLVIQHDLDVSQLKEIVNVLVKHGVLQEGIKKQLDDRGCLTLRMPGMKKDVREDNMSFEELAAIGKEPGSVEEKEGPRYNQGGIINGPLQDILDVFDFTALRPK